MKKTKRILFLLTLLILCFAGCTSKVKINKESETESETERETETEKESETEPETTKTKTKDKKNYTIVSNGAKLTIPSDFEVSIDDETGDIYIKDENLNWELVMIVREGLYEDSMEDPDELMSNVNLDEAKILEKIKEIDVKGKKYAYFTFKYNDEEVENTVIYTGATNKTRIAINMRIVGDVSVKEAIESIHTFLNDIESTKVENTLQKELDDAKKDPVGEEKEESKLKCGSISVKFKVPNGFYSVFDFADELQSSEGFVSEDESIDVNVQLDISGMWSSEKDYLNNELKTYDRKDDYYKTLERSEIKTIEVDGNKVHYITVKYTVAGEDEETFQKIFAILSIDNGNNLILEANTLQDVKLTIDTVKGFFYLGK